jgi:hypothetical protein
MNKATDLALVTVTVVGAILTLLMRKTRLLRNTTKGKTECNNNCGCAKYSPPPIGELRQLESSGEKNPPTGI